VRASELGSSASVLPATRFVFWADLVGVFLAGAQFVFFPDRTEDLASWTIAVPLTAAFLGFAYGATLPSIVLAIRMRRWARVRILPVMALVLTTLALLATLRDLDKFHFNDGVLLARTAAWFWLILYALLPPLNLGVFVLQERSSAGHPDPVERPLISWVRALLFLYAVGLTVIGLGLVFAFGSFDGLWPWPLTRLTAGVIGGFLTTLAAGCWWALRAGDWMPFRLAVPFFLICFLAQIPAAILHRSDFEPDSGIWVYVGILLVSFALFGLAAWHQERNVE
jgi:hypothetical protein